MLRVTFYSYKGGVGRTLALLNVAALFARHGRKVVAVDLDLEAPGFGLSALTRSPDPGATRGVSDFLLERRAGQNAGLEASSYAYPILREQCGDNLWLMPAGRRAKELADAIPRLYEDLSDPSARLFDLLVAEIDHALAPEYLFFDSRTGIADIAGVCTLELPQVVVAVCGLSEQNVEGMASALQQMREFRSANFSPEVATILVLSPVPRLRDLNAAATGASPPLRTTWQMIVEEDFLAPEESLLARRLETVQLRVLQPIHDEFGPGLRDFPNLRHQDLSHQLEYDPLVPLSDELQVVRASALAEQYRQLALSISRAASSDAELVMLDGKSPWNGL